MHTHRHKPAARAQARPVSPARTTPPAVEVKPSAPAISGEDIRLRAYQKWEQAGMPAGDGVSFWLEAERELVRGA